MTARLLALDQGTTSSASLRSLRRLRRGNFRGTSPAQYDPIDIRIGRPACARRLPRKAT